MGIEPTYSAWKADVLPLNHTCISCCVQKTDKYWSGWQDSNLRPPGPKPGALAKLSHTPIYHLLMVFIKLLSFLFLLPDDKWYYIIAIYKCQHFFWIFLKKLFFTFFPSIQRFSCHLRLAYVIIFLIIKSRRKSGKLRRCFYGYKTISAET